LAKARVLGLSRGMCVILRLAIWLQYRSVTDRQTHDDDIYRASIVSCGTKTRLITKSHRCVGAKT